ncbi:MAG TPA: aspartate kinase [Thermoanaerobaculia bacterium]|nr:aspartate kinase [Thermoanaerobaculia bacterium]
MSPRVLKFGGTSVGSAGPLAVALKLVAEARTERPVVVVASALAGVTNQLIEALGSARDGALDPAAFTAALAGRHRELLAAVAPGPLGATATLALRRTLAEVEVLLGSIRHSGRIAPVTADRVLAAGERLSVLVFAAGLTALGVPAEAVDATELIATDGRFGEAEVDEAETGRRTRQRLSRLAEVVPVVTGFFGAGPGGETTLLGRGGSDTSATLVAAALGAERVEIWSDVDGVFTADPRHCPEARLLPQLSFEQAALLAEAGAKVLHPKSVAPAARHGIPIWVRNTFSPLSVGTWISAELPAGRELSDAFA